jgi:hypothetical protein
VIVVLLVVSLGIPFLLNYQRGKQEASDLRCVTNWANATAARSDRILNLSNAKNAAADAVNRALAAALEYPARITPAQVQALTRTTQAYLAASNDYNNALRANPLPASPQLQCGHKAQAQPASVVVTKTEPGGLVVTTTIKPGPTTTARSTVLVPQPTTIPGAVQTVRVPMPVATVTRTVIRARTRTVTRTVSPPACLKNLVLPPCVLQAAK